MPFYQTRLLLYCLQRKINATTVKSSSLRYIAYIIITNQRYLTIGSSSFSTTTHTAFFFFHVFIYLHTDVKTETILSSNRRHEYIKRRSPTTTAAACTTTQKKLGIHDSRSLVKITLSLSRQLDATLKFTFITFQMPIVSFFLSFFFFWLNSTRNIQTFPS